MSQHTSKALYFINAFKIGEPWKYLQKSLGLIGIEEVPSHIAEAQFKHLWNTDKKFQEISLEWLSNTSIELMEVVKSFNVIDSKSNKSKSKKIILTESSLGGSSKGVSSIVIDKITGLKKSLDTDAITKKVYGTSFSKKQRQSVYMALYFLHQKGIVEKSGDTSKVFWLFTGQAPKLKAPAKAKTTRKQIDHININDAVLEILSKEKDISTSDIRSTLEQSGVLDSKKNFNQNRVNKALYKLEESGSVIKHVENPSAPRSLRKVSWNLVTN